MVWWIAIWLGLSIATSASWADAVSDCNQSKDLDLAIRGCTQYIEKSSSSAAKGNRAIAYNIRGNAYKAKGDLDRAIADYNKAIELNPKKQSAYNNRGVAYRAKGDHDRAIADLTKAIELDPKFGSAYNVRGSAYLDKGDHDRAIMDQTKAIELAPKEMAGYLRRGNAYRAKGDVDRAITDFSQAIEINPEDPEPYAGRCAAFESKGMTDRGMRDCQTALQRTAKSSSEKQAHVDAQAIISRLQFSVSRPAVPNPASAGGALQASPVGRRVALIIGNSTYENVARLTNPSNDARAIAASLRRLGFNEVTELNNLRHSAMGTALKEFGDKSASADWSVVYFSGHGIEVNGIPYLVPIDAKLERDTHVPDETVSLSRVLEKVEGARKLRLVILDACRNNPFLTRMVRSAGATRTIGRGLAAIEPEGGVLVAYAAKHGSTADDGAGANSPFVEALLANLEEPGLEIGFLFRRVRDQVLTSTGRRQEPFLYGSLPSESLYFKQAVPR